MSEPLDIGDALKGAREAKGWAVKDAAAKLHLMVRQIEAMETEDYAALGQPVFARGFVRNYAKLLGIDSEPLLQRMSETGAAPAEKVESEGYSADSSSAAPPILIGSLAVMALLLAIPVGLYWWLNSGGEEERQAESSAQTKPVMRTAPFPATAIETESGAAAGSAVANGAPALADTSAAKPAPIPNPPPAPAPKAAATALPPEPAKPKPEDLPAPAPVAVAPEAPENPYLPENFRRKSIRLQFDEDAWVKIVDSNGRTILSNLNKAGSTVDISGKPPFEFVVGNAANVRMSYNGRPFDIKPYIGATVARFTLE